jgi:hypothetical protein
MPGTADISRQNEKTAFCFAGDSQRMMQIDIHAE